MDRFQAQIKLQVWKSRKTGIVTVVTELPDGSGTRLCGVKLLGSFSSLIAEFNLDRKAIDCLSLDLNTVERELL